jgi:hypothetical protein
MEHIVQFAIGIDDEAITERIQENAEKIITQNIQQKVERSIFKFDYRGRAENRLNDAAETVLTNWLESHKDEIIKLASKALADKMIRTKAVKTAIDGVLKDGVLDASN